MATNEKPTASPNADKKTRIRKTNAQKIAELEKELSKAKEQARKEEAHIKIVLGGILIKTFSVLEKEDKEAAKKFGIIMAHLCCNEKDFKKATEFMFNEIREKRETYMTQYKKNVEAMKAASQQPKA